MCVIQRTSAARIDKVLAFYKKECLGERGVVSQCGVADIMADIRHWHDEQGLDYYMSDDNAYQYYLQEK